MDELDKKIVNELQIHGFQKSETLAARFDIGSRTIRRRVSLMKSKGIFKIIPVPNYVLLGYKAWAKVGIKVCPGAANGITDKLLEHPSVYFVACSFGKFDFIIAVNFSTTDELSRYVNSELTEIPGIQNVETLLLDSPRKYYNFSWPAPRLEVNYRKNINSATSNYKIDDTDRRIISVLTQNGFANPAALKPKLGMAEGTIRKRIKEMQRHNIFKVEVAPNPMVLEYEVWATIGINTNQSAHAVIDAIIKNQAVYLASTSIGRFNIIISARFHNIEIFSQFVNVELAKIRGINYIESFLHTKPLKYHNIKWR